MTNLKGYGKIWFGKKAINNILAPNNVNGSGVFTIHTVNGKYVNIDMHTEEIHYNKIKSLHITLFQTIKYNESEYTQQNI